MHQNQKTLFSDKAILRVLTVSAVCFSLCSIQPGFAHDHDHRHGQTQEQEIKPPKLYLDANPRAVQFQLKRLDNQRLLLAERRDDDKKYLPVHEEILKRDGMARQDRQLALNSISKINSSDNVAELLKLIPQLDESQKDQKRIANQLAMLLLAQKPETLKSHIAELIEVTKSENKSLQKTGYAGLITAGDASKAIELSNASKQATATLLKSIPLLPSKQLRNALHGKMLESLGGDNSTEIRNSAITALSSTDSDPAKVFQAVSPLVGVEQLRRAAVKTLLKIPRKNRDEKSATLLSDLLVNHAESTPADKRTTDEFIEAMQLADQVLGLVKKDKGDAIRQRLSKVSVRVILLHAVEEEMRYDIPWFAVQAGRDIQVVLKNEDLMAHNLVITKPEALQEVANLAAADGPKIGPSGKQYVPDSDKVLFATEMIQAEKKGKITFTAPTIPGEYPYVCTFPGHWMRMYGVMVVVEDLSEFQRNPVEPKDPVGSNRPIVQAWTFDDFKDITEAGLVGRTPKIGKKIFKEATCALCHKVAGEGQAVGPDLTEVWSRLKGDGPAVLREIIEPSHKIDPKYIVRKVVTIDGEVISGIVLREDKNEIAILPNPESKEPTVIKQDDIDDMMKSSVSIMPKALMDRFTKDEIFELVNYLKSVDPKK